MLEYMYMLENVINIEYGAMPDVSISISLPGWCCPVLVLVVQRGLQLCQDIRGCQAHGWGRLILILLPNIFSEVMEKPAQNII